VNRLRCLLAPAAGAALLVAVSIVIAPPARAAIPAVAPVRAEDRAPAGNIRIAFDDSALRTLLDLIAAKDSSDASLEKWLDLPANKAILSVGERQGDLTRAQLKANAKAVIEGTATPREQPRGDIGRLLVTRPEEYRQMLNILAATSGARSERIAVRLRQFLPREVEKEAITPTVYLHLGGDWDALNVNGDIYLNVAFWHDYNKPGWDGLNMIVAHEAMHTVQNRAYGNPEAQDDGDGAFLTALSKIQREGTARYVETETDPDPYEEYSYGFFYRAVDYERLRSFGADMALLAPVADACYPTFDKEKFAQAFTAGINAGGPFYDVGHGIAKVIDEKMGRKALLETVRRGPKDFYTKYLRLCDRDKSLPRLPESVAARVRTMKERL
jgi:hypothetical protein